MTSPPRVPPRFVPTLTEIVEVPDPPSTHAPPPDAEPVLVTNPLSADLAPALPDGFEEVVVHRVMQRVDVLLEQRLRLAVAQVTEEQTRSLVPRLREEVESVVRQSVYEAVAQELASERDIR